MPLADHHPPVVVADAQHIVFDEPQIGRGHRRHRLAETAIAGPPARDLFVVPAGGAIEDRPLVRRWTAFVGDQHPRRHIFQPRHQQRRVEPRAQPARQADMVGMHMSADDPLDRLAAQRAPERRLPGRLGRLGLQSCVHQGPAVAVRQGIDIDMVQAQRQRQTHPQDAGRNLDRLTGFRHASHRIGQSPLRSAIWSSGAVCQVRLLSKPSLYGANVIASIALTRAHWTGRTFPPFDRSVTRGSVFSLYGRACCGRPDLDDGRTGLRPDPRPQSTRGARRLQKSGRSQSRTAGCTRAERSPGPRRRPGPPDRARQHLPDDRSQASGRNAGQVVTLRNRLRHGPRLYRPGLHPAFGHGLPGPRHLGGERPRQGSGCRGRHRVHPAGQRQWPRCV
ncbi:hypothetical protein D3C80_1097350 [compost metagenome]